MNTPVEASFMGFSAMKVGTDPRSLRRDRRRFPAEPVVGLTTARDWCATPKG